MSIRREMGPPRITSDDFTFEHRGRLFGIELTEWDGINLCSLFESVGGVWGVPDFGAAGERLIHLEWVSNANIEAVGGARMWIRDVFVPWLNTLLAALFPATDAANPAPVGSAIEQVDALLKSSVRLTPGAGGTLSATYIGG